MYHAFAESHITYHRLGRGNKLLLEKSRNSIKLDSKDNIQQEL